MNLEEFFLSFQDFQNEIGVLIDDDSTVRGDFHFLWDQCDQLLAILEKIINVGKSGETR